MIDVLIEKIKEKNNPTVAGLDPKLDYVPDFIKKEFSSTFEGAAGAILEFNKMLIDQLCEVVAAVKPQSAYYEMYGPHGVKALEDTNAYAREKGMYVITDGKRNDIGTTAEAYSIAYLGETKLIDSEAAAFGSDGLTVNGYLGTDGIKPFVKADKSIFVLVKTSNPSSGELQDLVLENGRKVYEQMAHNVNTWGAEYIGKYGYSNVGAVVGATYPEQIVELRKIMPKAYFLVPGYGAQGGTAADVAKAFNSDGLGAVVNASRSIMCAYKKAECDEKDFALAAKEEAIRMRDDIMSAL